MTTLCQMRSKGIHCENQSVAIIIAASNKNIKLFKYGIHGTFICQNCIDKLRINCEDIFKKYLVLTYL